MQHLTNLDTPKTRTTPRGLTLTWTRCRLYVGPECLASEDTPITCRDCLRAALRSRALDGRLSLANRIYGTPGRTSFTAYGAVRLPSVICTAWTCLTIAPVSRSSMLSSTVQ